MAGYGGVLVCCLPDISRLSNIATRQISDGAPPPYPRNTAIEGELLIICGASSAVPSRETLFLVPFPCFRASFDK